MSIKAQQKAKTQEMLELKRQKAELADKKKAEREEQAEIERKIRKQKETEAKRIAAQEAAEELLRIRKEEERQQRLLRRENFQKTQSGLQQGTNLLAKLNKMINKESKNTANPAKLTSN